MIIHLENRAVLKVSGEEAKPFLNGLITADMAQMPAFAALLSPQGKLLVDFFVSEIEDGFLLDCARANKDLLLTKLKTYKLRAKVLIEDFSEETSVFALFNETHKEAFTDPRSILMGQRLIVFNADAPKANGTASDYLEKRIEAIIPQGGEDFIYGDVFVHDVNMHEMNALSYTKGCYVGQEIVARMQHRGSARKRVVRYKAEMAVMAGLSVYAGETLVGTTGSGQNGRGLMLVRTDKLDAPLMAGGISIRQDNGQ